jgi:hypothetical protein
VLSLRLNLGEPECPATDCDFYVRRGVARRVGGWVAAHRQLVDQVLVGALATGVCGAAKIERLIVRIGCEQLVGQVIGAFVRSLREAAEQDACVRVSAGLPVGGTHHLRFLTFASDTSARCRT